MEEMNPISRDFKGVWIPKNVWLDTDLNALDKIILTEIDSLDNGEYGCFASNRYLAEFCQCSESKISKSISSLVKLGYIYIKSFNGRCREIKSLLSQGRRKPCKKNAQNGKSALKKISGCLVKNARHPSKKCEAESEKMLAINIDNNIDNNIYNNDHFSKNDRVSDLAEQGFEVIKETTVPVVGESRTKSSSLNNRIVISKSQSEETNKRSSSLNNGIVISKGQSEEVKKEKKVAAKKEKAARVSNELLNSEFENIWASYPRKQGKKAAKAAFIRARKSGVELDTIASGIEAYVNYIRTKKISQEYVKQGSTFFNQNSWDDEWEMGNKPSMPKKHEEQQDSYLKALEVAREGATKLNDQEYLEEINELERKYLESLEKNGGQKNKDLEMLN